MRVASTLVVVFCLTGCSSSDPPAVPAPGDITSTEISTSEHRFTARATGPTDGEVVFLLHGFPETSYEWIHQLPALGEAGYRAIAPDQRGYAAAARPEAIDAYAVELLVQDVLEMADALGAESFHVVGHDWGAGVAWGLAGAAPDRVTTLSILSIPHPAAFNAELADMESCQYQASSYFDFFASPAAEDFFLANDAAGLRGTLADVAEDAIEEYVRVLSEPGAMTAALNWYRANIVDRAFATAELGEITSPTMFIWSDADSAVCREPAEATADHVSGPYRFEVMEGVGHWIPEVAADEVTALLLEHLGN